MNEKNKRFFKTFLSHAAISMVPIVVLGFFTIGVLFESIASNTKKLNLNVIDQYVSMIDTEVEKALSLFYKIENNEKIHDLAKMQANVYNSKKYDLHTVTKEIRVLMTDNPSVKQVGVCLSDQNSVITSDSVTTIEEFYQLNFLPDEISFKKLKGQLDKSGLKTLFIPATNSEGEEFVFCYKRLNVKGLMKKSFIFVILDSDVLISKIKVGNVDAKVNFALIDSDGNVIVKSEKFNEKYKQEESDSNNVVYRNSSVVNCKFVFDFPEEGLEGNIGYITLVFLLLTLITLVANAVIAVLHMQKFKKVFLSVFSNNEDTKESFDKQIENARERSLLNLIHNFHGDSFGNAEVIKNYAISFPKRYLAVMTVSSAQTSGDDFYSSVEETAWAELNEILKYRINEVRINCDVVRTGNATYSYILNFDEEGTTKRLKELPKILSKDYDIIINFGVGSETEDIEKIYISYEQSIFALRYGLNEKSKSTEIVFYEQIHNLENSKIYYTGEKENQLIRSIKIGSKSNVKEILEEIYTVNFKERHLSLNALKRLVCTVSLTIYKTLDEFYEHDTEKHEKYGRVCQNLFNNDDAEACFVTLWEICLSLCDDIAKRTDGEDLKIRIINYLAENFSNDALSLEMLADNMGISYHYLSRQFKEYFGTNFVSYLTLFRLEKAKSLLEKSDESIEKIAKKVGFIGSNSLIRAFNKYYDITPAKYRKML